MNAKSLCGYTLALLAAPLLAGVISRTKAVFAGRHGPPLLQLYHDLFKLLRKGAVYSRTATWVFRAGPPLSLAAVLLALLLLPQGGLPAVLAFDGDFLVLVYLLGLMRFVTVLAALDTGSSFEGMGASREVQISALAEPALLLGFAAMVRLTGAASLSGISNSLPAAVWTGGGVAAALVVAAWTGVFLAENSRLPVDDPNTHLELTMIHEAMILDHGGPDLALIQYGAALKLWLLGGLITGVCLPLRSGVWLWDLAAFAGGMLLLAVVVGVVESTMARLRLLRVSHLLLAAGAAAVLALVLVWR